MRTAVRTMSQRPFARREAATAAIATSARREEDAYLHVEDALRRAESVTDFGTDIEATMRWAGETSRHAPLPGDGATPALWQLLANTARLDVGAARILEPHLDAQAILHQAYRDGAPDVLVPDEAGTWGVYAAEGPGVRVDARRSSSGWTLTGTKPWCSLARSLSHALVTAWISPEERAVFAVALRQPSVTAHDGPWASRGLAQIVSAPIDFSGTPADIVGAPGWYLHRQGFWWGGLGVAAAWWGGALPLRDALAAAAQSPRADQFALAAFGEADAALWAARTALADAAAAVDAGAEEGRILAERVRAVVVDAVERTVALADRALGPAPLTADEDHARRVSDLRIYVRQHHGERDLARLGRLLVSA